VLPPFERYAPLEGGAIATVTRHLARELEQRGHEVTVVTPSPAGGARSAYVGGSVVTLSYGAREARGRASRGRAARAALHGEARLRRWSWPDYGSYRRSVASALRSLHPAPDAVVVHNDPDLLCGSVVRAGRGVLWLHNLLGPGPGRRLSSLPEGTRVVAVSEAVRRWTLEHHPLPPGSVTVVHNGVDPVEFAPRRGFTENVPVVRVLCHGRLEPGKGYDVAVEAVGRLRRRGAPVALSLAGAPRSWGVASDQLDSYVEELLRRLEEIGGRYLGSLDAGAMAAVVAEHDVGCAPSRALEPFCLSALEAMAAGCAVVASDRGGLPEVVGEAGILVGHDDVEALSSALGTLAGDAALLAQRKLACRERALQFSWARGAEALEGLVA
jgi:glycosyltransferase involved in cell wall biosynthesis